MKSVLRGEEKKTAGNLIKFIEQSPSMFHVIQNIKDRLKKDGAEELKENMTWQVKAGKTYYVTRNDSALIAFRLPVKMEYLAYHIFAAHSDSPSFRVKPKPEIGVDNTYIKLNVEKYGGMIMSTWLDRPLSLAGRVMYKSDGKLQSGLVNIDKDLLVIPNVAIHLNRNINEGFSYNAQTDMLPLMTMGEQKLTQGLLCEVLAEQLKVKKQDILDYDLFLYVREKGRIAGLKDDFVISPKLDDLQSVYAGMEAFLAATPTEYCNVLAVFDNEEVGSSTKQGADSTFLIDSLERLHEGMKMKRDQRELVADSFLISADNGHALHPNHPEKSDPTNKPVLNGGIVIKYHGGQKYTSDAVSGAHVKTWAEGAGVPYQTYTNRSDILGGSTLGNISTAHVSLNSVDVGFPQLAMHSAVETGGSRDTYLGIELFKAYYNE